jgi:hypothetical protein
MTVSNDDVDGVDRGGGDDWAMAEERAGRKAQWVVLGLGVGLWAATVALGGPGGLAVPLILGFAAAGGLSVSGAV